MTHIAVPNLGETEMLNYNWDWDEDFGDFKFDEEEVHLDWRKLMRFYIWDRLEEDRWKSEQPWKKIKRETEYGVWRGGLVSRGRQTLEELGIGVRRSSRTQQRKSYAE